MTTTGAKKNQRVIRLREKMLQMPEICTERAYLWTQSHMETECDTSVIRRAKALARVLKDMTIHIDEDELIVGRTTSKRRGGMLFPEVQWECYIKEMELLSTRDWDRCGAFTLEEKERLLEVLPYWKGKCTWDKFNAAVPEDILRYNGKIFNIGTSSMSGVHFGHETADYEKLLNRGLRGIMKDVEDEMANLDLTDLMDFEKYQFLEAMNITLKAGIDFAERYAALAKEMAGAEHDAGRKAELEQIAEICSRVPANPPRTFQEALQSVWFAHIVLRIEGWGPGLSLGRCDQYLYPFFQEDISTKKLTKEDAVELLGMFLVKVNDLAPVMGTENIETLGGFPTMVNITIGGVTRDGKDAVNDLSYIFLEAEEAVALNAEELTIRISRSNSDGFLMKALEVSKLLRGKFKFVSDDTIISQILSEGRPVEHARDYVLAGCFTPAVPVHALDITASITNLPSMLELSLNNGVARLTGEQLGPRTGDPRLFTSYEEVWDAYKRQVEYFMPKLVAARNIDVQLYSKYAQLPFMSSLHSGCIEKGRDIIDGGTAPYARESHGLSGMPNVSDSLAAIKKVVFDDKKTTMSRLIDALDKNFDGEGEILHLLANAPKFGNDDDYVDSIANDVVTHFSDTLAQYKGIFGTKPAINVATGTGHLIMGTQVGATPEGRKAGEPFAEGGISPHQGRNVSGPTSTLRSVAKINHFKALGGSVLNMKFNPDIFSTDVKKRKFLSMLRTYCETGGYHVQFNIVSADTLRDAQNHPENYRDLLVRVATYSSYFVELSPRMQEDIIARTEFEEL